MRQLEALTMGLRKPKKPLSAYMIFMREVSSRDYNFCSNDP